MTNAKDLSGFEKLFAATRTDGFGARLVAIVNAMFLAHETGWGFGFTWNAATVANNVFHPVEGAAAIFDRSFLDEHHLGAKLDGTGFAQLGDTPFSIAQLRARAAGVKGWNCDHLEITRRMIAAEAVKQEGTARAFRRIRFAEPFRDAIRAADAAPLPGPMTAIHLRSGDIVHGPFRRQPKFAAKVIPSALAKAMIRLLRERGTDVILFGEHHDTLHYLKSETGCRLVEDFEGPSPDEGTVRALFEMVLMSRCAEIYARDSMFAVMASTIGSAPIRSPDALLGEDRHLRVLLEELKNNASAYHPLEAAYGYLYAYTRLPRDAGAERQEQLLDQAYRFDPSNDFYSLKKAAFRFAEGRYREGEAILSRLYPAIDKAAALLAERAIRLLGLKIWGHDPDWRDDFPLFKAAALAGMPNAAACCALYLNAHGDRPGALEMIGRARAAQPRNLLFRRVARTIRRAGRTRRTRLKAFLRGVAAKCARSFGISRPSSRR
jgi:hypothetical protein